jgi:hypothetical protein
MSGSSVQHHCIRCLGWIVWHCLDTLGWSRDNVTLTKDVGDGVKTVGSRMGEAKRATYEGQDVFACFTGASLSQSRRSAPSTVGLNCRLGLCMLDCLGPHWASARLPSVLPPRKSPPDDRTATRHRTGQRQDRTATRLPPQPADVGLAVNRAEYTLMACHTCHVQPPHSGWHPRLAPTAGMHLHSLHLLHMSVFPSLLPANRPLV